MKLSILPKFNMQADEKELAYEHEQLYKGSNPFLSYILNNMFYILAFLIPLGTFLFLMNHFGFVPFGDLNFFIIDGAYVNLPVLTGLISDLREGSFHLYTLQGSAGSEIISSILYYLTSPFTLFCLLFNQKTAVILLTVFSVLRICLSGPVFMYYLTHRAIGRKGSKYDPMMLVLSLGYSLSNFALVQYEDFMYLDHFMLFPLLILFMEQFIAKGTWKKFLALNTFLLLSNFYLGLILNIFLVVYYFVKCTGNIESILRRFIKFLGILVGSSALSAVTVVPGVFALYEKCHASTMTLSQAPVQGDIYAFFLRHLFYSNPSFMDIGQLGANVYFGIFLLLLVFLYFMSPQFSLSEKIRDGLFLVLLVLSINVLQTSYFIHLQTLSNSLYTCYTFAYIFFVLSLAHKILPRLRTMNIWCLLIALFIPVLLTILSLSQTTITPVYNAAYYSFALMLFYGILILLYRIGSTKRDSFFSLILCLFCLEIFANAFQVTFQNAKQCSNITESFVTTSYTYGSGEDFIRAEMPENAEFAYQKNLLSQYSFNRIFSDPNTFPTTSPLYDSMNGVQYIYLRDQLSHSTVNLLQYKKIATTEDYTILENTCCFPAAYAVPGKISNHSIDSSTYINEQNSLAKLLGSSSDVYIEDKEIIAEISLSDDAAVETYSYGNNIFAITNQTDTTKDTTVDLTMTFTPSSSGELYLLMHGTPSYYGSVVAGKEYTHNFSLDANQFFDNCFWVQFFYPDLETLKKLSDKLHSASCSINYKSINSINIEANFDEPSTIVTPLPFDSKFYIDDSDKNNYSIFDFNGRLSIYVPDGKHSIILSYRHTPFVIGILLTAIFTLGFILFSRKSVVANTKNWQKKLYKYICNALHVTVNFLSENYVYFLAFFLPFAGYLFVNILLYIEPFGPFSRFDADGRSILLPINFASSDLLKNGLSTHSWDGVGGFNTTAVIQLYLCTLVYYFVPDTWIPLYTTFFPLVLISLSGVSLVYYLTHRLFGKRANKKDYRLLISVFCYTLCNYMVLNQNNANWYYILTLLPLILLSMDHLMIREKKRYYIIALSLSLLTHYYVTMFICFYLVIRFFTYEFHGFADFILKGLRFAFSSLFTGCLSLFTLYFALTSLNGSTYGVEDSVYPTFKLFHGFEYIINRLSAFYNGFTISWDEGNVNLYFGILPLLLLVIYVFLHRISLKNKLRLLIPYGIFFLSLNEAVLNFIFNGLHYQHGVPNRYVFLVVLIAAFISYDCFRVVERISKKTVVFSTLGLLLLFGGSYAISEPSDRNSMALTVTLFLLLLYGILLCRPWRKKFSHKKWRITLLVLLFIEMITNSYYQCLNHYSSNYHTTQMASTTDFAKEKLYVDDTLNHVAMLAPLNDNLGLVHHLKTNTLFSTSLTSYHLKYGEYVGCFSGANNIDSFNSQTLAGYAVGNTQYLILNTQSRSYNVQDAKYHTPIALTDCGIIFENKNYFPFAYYVPQKVQPLLNIDLTSAQMWNAFSAMYCNQRDTLVEPYVISNKVDNVAKELNFTVPNLSDLKAEREFFTQIYLDETNEKFDVYLECNAPATGSLYANLNDYQYIGDFQAGDRVSHTIDGRSLNSNSNETELQLYTINNDLLTELCAEVNKHPFQVESFTDEFVSGSIDMPEDGYINFTMPYDERWNIRIDGEKVEAQSLGNGFLTLYAEKGFHEVTMEYVDNRRLPVLLITLSFWVLFLAACKISDRRAKKVADKTTENTNES